jgi:uncharacterized membrane protein
MSDGIRNWLLLISAGLNLFLLGVLLPNTDRLFGPRPPQPRMVQPLGPGGPLPAPMAFMGEISRTMTPPDAEIFCGAMRDLPDGFLSMEDELRIARRESQRLLRAPTFDEENFKAALSRGIVARSRFEEHQRDALARAAIALSEQGRVLLGSPPRRGGGPEFRPPLPPREGGPGGGPSGGPGGGPPGCGPR